MCKGLVLGAVGWGSSLEPTEHEGLKAQQPAHTSRIFFLFRS